MKYCESLFDTLKMNDVLMKNCHPVNDREARDDNDVGRGGWVVWEEGW